MVFTSGPQRKLVFSGTLAALSDITSAPGHGSWCVAGALRAFVDRKGGAELVPCRRPSESRSVSVSAVSDSVTPWPVARQAPPSVGLSREEYWSGWPRPPPGDLPDPGIEPSSPALTGRLFNMLSHLGRPDPVGFYNFPPVFEILSVQVFYKYQSRMKCSHLFPRR